MVLGITEFIRRVIHTMDRQGGGGGTACWDPWRQPELLWPGRECPLTLSEDWKASERSLKSGFLVPRQDVGSADIAKTSLPDDKSCLC